MGRLIHYPWRCRFPVELWGQDLPIPETGTAAPGIGAFDVGEMTIEELPGPTVREGAGQIRCRVSNSDYLYDPRKVFQYQGEPAESFIRRFHFALTDAFIHLSNLLYGKHRRENGVFADLPLSAACRDFADYLSQEHDFASESLIVEIARNCQATIEGIVRSPHLMLFRRHSEVALDRLQELDEYSLRALAHRPGRTIAAKAGGRQRLTGVVRQETSDTYENRVVMDFVRRSDQNAVQYVREMCGRCPMMSDCASHDPVLEGDKCPSARVKAVAGYHRKCLAWLQNDNMKSVHRLPQPAAKVNYVLQQNPRYVTVWRHYQRLLLQENVEEDVWRWMRRTWADYLRLVMMTVWELRLKADSLVELSNRPLMIHSGNERGAWFCSDPFEEALVYKSSQGDCDTIYLLNPKELVELTGIQVLAELNCDFFWVAMQKSRLHSLMPVWAICGMRNVNSGMIAAAPAIAQEVDRVIRFYNGMDDIRESGWRLSGGMVVLPSPQEFKRKIGKSCVWGCCPFSPDMAFLEQKVRGLLK